MKITAADIAKITGGRITGNPDYVIHDIITDSRHLIHTDEAAFVAITGVNHDGHKFIHNLYQKGVKVFISEKIPKEMHNLSEATFIVTDNSIDALQSLASHKRNSFSKTVIAVTGSTGKTIVKEWLADILGASFPVLRSPKSYNSQIGVPLSVWKLEQQYDMAVFEAGISKPGEMARLRQIIRPDVGIITNIGDAHSENFTDNESKAREKLLLFSESSSIIYCRDHELIHKLISENPVLKSKNLISWSFHDQNANLSVSKINTSDQCTLVSLRYKGLYHEFSIPFSDRASVENALTVITACLALGLDPAAIKEGVRSLHSIAMRMEIRNGINNCQLIEDFYNSDPGSLIMAVEYLKSQSSRKRTLILSDFMQSGRDVRELCEDVADIVRKAGIEKFVGIGPVLFSNRNLFDKSSEFFYSTEEFLSNFNGSSFSNETILLKGARIFEFEKIAHLLELQTHTTVLDVSLDAIVNNLNELRRHLNLETRIMAMVKAFAYGSGLSEIASVFEYNLVNYLAVAYPDEGVELRKSGCSLPVMVMNPEPGSGEVMVKHNLEPEIFSFETFVDFERIASKHGLIEYPVHIKIDTGMHRLGFMPDEVSRLSEMIGKTSRLKIASVFTHLAASDDPSFDEFTHRQVKMFLEAIKEIEKVVSYPFLKHVLNTSGIARFPQYQFDMVRPGIGLYGVGRYEGLYLRPAGCFRTKISQVKRIPAGEPVGYNCMDVSDSDREVAILPVGYADGLDRRLGGG
ncbi:MAG: bifunctional UDP-N-acetylmuramoyl-tripeptide:D-alanyl-D-alanine ligase/alanine racemase, partial [Bacteroidales bacterium]|nr:bifunctional UDP-N-acetylmuramoyl-tripeptide:D-alanyl-D-alanine ligase/alanine racemase [Bacteroidales bacterium]